MSKDINNDFVRIESKAIKLFDEIKAKKQNLLQDEEIKSQLYDYIFGDGENPFEEITEEYRKNIQGLEKQIAKIADSERQNYVGKSKKSVRFIKTLKIDPNNM